MTQGQRLAVSALPAAIVTLALVALMQLLIAERPAADSGAANDRGIRFGSVELPPPTPPRTIVEPKVPEAKPMPPGIEAPEPGNSGTVVGPGNPLELFTPPIHSTARPEIPGVPGGQWFDGDLALRTQPHPVYPHDALMRGIEGWVEVGFTVRADGSTADVRVIESHPGRTFDHAAVAAVRRWRFVPPVVDGEPREVRSQQRITFRIEDG